MLRIGKIVCIVLHEAFEQQVEETVETLSEGPKDFHNSHLD